MKRGDGTITFYDHCLPALESGTYTVKANPELHAGGPKDNLDSLQHLETMHTPEKSFQVAAPRFSLTGDEAYSCYPPPGGIGNYAGVLPHIVFDRRTLPWERTLKRKEFVTNANQRDPWLALILLSEGEGGESGSMIKPAFGTVGDLVGQEERIILPDLTLEEYESASDPCRILDLPVKLFSRVMPRCQDLDYLAHVREVSTDGKETWSLLKDGFFSVVVCNRMPETAKVPKGEKDWGIRNTVHLVSIEGWEEFFDSHANDAADSVEAKVEDWTDARQGKMCRLLVLASWEFHCQGRNDFKGFMTALDDEQPFIIPTKLSEGIDKPVRGALGQGFAPLEHHFRTGETGISWYRGPLSPVRKSLRGSYDHISTADAALVFDRGTGMFNASYAAAWELGRLLALQDQAFCKALGSYREAFGTWLKRTNASTIAKEIGDDETRDELLNVLPTSGERGLADHYLDALARAGYIPAAPAAKSDGEFPPELPVTLHDWLGEALLLYGVPLSYLVPNEMMLKRGSIRFFYLDPDWISCFLQGACSVARNSQADELVDQILRTRFFEASCRIAEGLRANAKAAADKRRGLGTPAKKEKGKAELKWPITGFLLRSDAVEEWIGLESTAWTAGKENPEELAILRMDRLAPDLLLCIYNGEISRLQIKQPSEAIHFGVFQDDDLYKKKLRIEKKGVREYTNPIAVPVRGNSRAVQIAALAASMPGVKGSSAEFAYQMIESPTKVIFRPPEERGSR
ncbi:MAG: hypothetical protein KDI43_10390 [Gammaproteobacteria bacterium]|nr:hypothetical protein [Gammaproteobacteria bacterium]